MLSMKCPKCKTPIPRNSEWTNKIYICPSCKTSISLYKYSRISNAFGMFMGIFIVLQTKDIMIIKYETLKDIISGIIAIFILFISNMIVPGFLMKIDYVIKKNKINKET